jgi:hypothetical protein
MVPPAKSLMSVNGFSSHHSRAENVGPRKNGELHESAVGRLLLEFDSLEVQRRLLTPWVDGSG